MSFANLKKQSKLGSLTSKLVNQVEKMNKSAGSSDERLWKPEVDKQCIMSLPKLFCNCACSAASMLPRLRMDPTRH